jgi:hypothetical protein
VSHTTLGGNAFGAAIIDTLIHVNDLACFFPFLFASGVPAGLVYIGAFSPEKAAGNGYGTVSP